MCEWLSCREWCDVQLQCGGRSFAAHRAVLASVSAFLRQILLSCPTEDSQMFIVLPDFDLDAMSSVLYYIYNGEVVIQKQKLERFMEIVKALQIFVDEDYLPSVCKSVDFPLWSSLTDKRISERDKVFCLGESIERGYVTLRKGNLIECSLLKKPYNYSNFGDKQVRCGGWREDVLGSTESVCGDRQRGFLRDLFMETYPRNGNANGRAAGVLAIQSARYLSPASLLLTHANGKHLSVDDAEMQKKFINAHQWFITSQPPKPQGYINNIDVGNGNSNLTNFSELAQFKKFNSAFSYFNSKLMSQNSKTELVDHFSVNQSQMFSNRKSDLSRNQSEPRFSLNHFNSGNLIENNEINDRDLTTSRQPSKINRTHNIFTKTVVFNEVLDSPWRPRQPANYKPFRRKIEETSKQPHKYNLKESINDTNNNIQTSPATEVIGNITTSDTTTEPLALHTIAEFDVGSDLKCAVCDQVFTSPEALSSHVRRHSSPARYSCTECSKSFSQLRNFKYHMSIHRGTREFAATCTVCGKYFNDRGYLSSHMKIHRNRKEYKCSQCPKSFNQRVAYNMHVRIHTGIKPHVCAECGKAFSRKMLLKQHQRTHSGEKPYACTHCDKRFADRSNMTLHLRLHTGIKPFSCPLCPKSFTKKHHLKSHLNFHTGAKPYSCPKCNLAFTQSSNMRTHLKKCTAPDLIRNADSQNSS